MIINTHYHSDHVGGNHHFQDKYIKLRLRLINGMQTLLIYVGMNPVVQSG
ncbi:MBL fold metallo-hydrolase [Cytobacillus purgationiresistens]|nr:MBL fold metallo-hydrolase [Cytobacillus purgationiresistens]